MSVVVRMEFPLNCLECPMYDWNRQKLCCNAHLDLRPIPNGGVPKPDWCPIICKLPEGHGRLVDGDELYMTVKAHDTKRAVNQVRNGVIEEKHICLHDICQAQTIVPATNTPTNTPTDTPTVPAERSET